MVARRRRAIWAPRVPTLDHWRWCQHGRRARRRRLPRDGAARDALARRRPRREDRPPPRRRRPHAATRARHRELRAAALRPAGVDAHAALRDAVAGGRAARAAAPRGGVAGRARAGARRRRDGVRFIGGGGGGKGELALYARCADEVRASSCSSRRRRTSASSSRRTTRSSGCSAWRRAPPTSGGSGGRGSSQTRERIFRQIPTSKAILHVAHTREYGVCPSLAPARAGHIREKGAPAPPIRRRRGLLRPARRLERGLRGLLPSPRRARPRGREERAGAAPRRNERLRELRRVRRRRRRVAGRRADDGRRRRRRRRRRRGGLPRAMRSAAPTRSPRGSPSAGRGALRGRRARLEALGASSDEHDEHENETTPGFDLAVGTAGGEPGMSSSAACSAAGATPPGRIGLRRVSARRPTGEEAAGPATRGRRRASAPDARPRASASSRSCVGSSEERALLRRADGVVSGVSSPDEFERRSRATASSSSSAATRSRCRRRSRPDIDAARLAEEERFSMRRFDLT